MNKMPIAHLDRMIQQLEKNKSEYILPINVLKIILARKKQVVLKEDHEDLLRAIFVEMDRKKRDYEQYYLFFHLFEDVKKWKKEDFEDGDYILNQPYSSTEEEEENRINVKEALSEAEIIMEKHFKEFTQLLFCLLNLGRIQLIKMPYLHMFRWIEGLKFYKK